MIGLTGGGLFPAFPKNKLIILDVEQKSIFAEISLKYNINKIKIKNELIFVVCDFKIFIFNLFEKLELKMKLQTSFNSNGILETNGFSNPSYFAYILNLE